MPISITSFLFGVHQIFSGLIETITALYVSQEAEVTWISIQIPSVSLQIPWIFSELTEAIIQ